MYIHLCISLAYKIITEKDCDIITNEETNYSILKNQEFSTRAGTIVDG